MYDTHIQKINAFFQTVLVLDVSSTTNQNIMEFFFHDKWNQKSLFNLFYVKNTMHLNVFLKKHLFSETNALEAILKHHIYHTTKHLYEAE